MSHVLFFRSGAAIPFGISGKWAGLTLIWGWLSFSALHAQSPDSVRKVASLSASVGITNNGISLVPSFSLEKPAAIFNLSLEKGRFSFDPELTFSVEGKPWYALFWLRYKAIDRERFKLRTGAHLGLNYITENLPFPRVPSRVILTERYLVGELAPTCALTPKIGVGAYYLYARAFDLGTTDDMHFLALGASFSKISLPGELNLAIKPQVFFLDLYGPDGLYVTSTFTLEKKEFPLTLSSTFNKVIQTDIPVGRDFIWNVVLTYTFSKRYLTAEQPGK